MRLKKGTPGQGGSGKPDSFTYTQTAIGASKAYTAWLAGPVYWCQAHEHTDKQPGTKPCMDWLTDGQLTCPRCKPQVVPTWVGYVPLYREIDHAPILVIIHESVMDLVDGLSYPDHVIVGRMDYKTSVFVKKTETKVRFQTENERRKKPHDVTRDCLNMWKIPALESWLQSRPAPRDTSASDNAVSQGQRGNSAPPLRSDGTPFGAMHAAAAARYSSVPDAVEASAAFDEVTNRLGRKAAALPETSKNGNGKR